MKKSARIALHCLLAMVLTVPLAACGSDISYNVICDACILGLDPDIDIVPIGIVR